MASKPTSRRGPNVPHKKIEGRRIVARVVLGVVAISVIGFAVQGGEYGTTDLIRQRRAIARERARLDSLELAVKALERRRKAIEADPLVQERIAREEFGMVKGDREMLYRFVDTVRRDSARTP